MGRIYFKEAENYEVAKEFFGKAMVNFTLCQHYRGMYMTEEAIMDVAIKEKTQIPNEYATLESYNLHKQRYQHLTQSKNLNEKNKFLF